MTRKLSLVFLYIAFLLCWGAAYAATSLSVDNSTPEKLVMTLSGSIIQTISTHPELKTNREKALEYARSHVSPFFDFVRMTKLAVGQPWRAATPAQREALTHQFKELLMRTYIVAFSRYTDQKVRVDHEAIHGREALVKSTILGLNTGSGMDVDVEYRMIQREASRWQIYDVSVAGVSLVLNYRPQFEQVIRSQGVDQLIAMLKKQSEQLSSGSHS